MGDQSKKTPALVWLVLLAGACIAIGLFVQLGKGMGYGGVVVPPIFFCPDPTVIAALAGLPQTPTGNSPLVHPDRARQRRNQVLALMLDNGKISEAEYREAFAGEILPSLDRFRPDLIMISAGYDAHFMDDLAMMRLTVTSVVMLSTDPNASMLSILT